MDRVFLDANVLFSAAYMPDSGLLELWRRKEVRLLVSEYVVQEAMRNLQDAESQKRLGILLAQVEFVRSHVGDDAARQSSDIDLPEKDWPVWIAAMDAKATHLLTGDRRHFGRLLGKRIHGMHVLLPAQYLNRSASSDSGV